MKSWLPVGTSDLKIQSGCEVRGHLLLKTEMQMKKLLQLCLKNESELQVKISNEQK